MKNLPRHLQLNLAPLLLSLAVSQSYAVEVIVVGDAGVAGLPGAMLGAAGTAGGSATAVNGSARRAQAGALQLAVYGGAGGDGGRGGPISETVFGGDGGNGGHGAAASGSASLVADALDVAVQALVMGGNGGRGGTAGGIGSEFDGPPGDGPSETGPRVGRSGVPGRGGDATGAARAVTGGAGNVEVKAIVRGGGGGSVEGESGVGGVGGGATASVYGQSGSGRVGVTAEAYGGNGASGEVYRPSIGGNGASVTLIDAVSGRTSGELVLAQHAAGGNAGSGGEAVYGNGWPHLSAQVTAGSAESRLSINDDAASAITARVSAQGGTGAGRGDYWSESPSKVGGAAVAALTLASTRAGSPLDGTVYARGGTGSTGWIDDGGRGGKAEAAGQVSGLGDVRGNATAQGGSGGGGGQYVGYTNGGSGGDASATLGLAGTGMASGSAAAYGGAPGEGANYYGSPALGSANAALSLAGAGAQGSAFAEGLWANSAVSARTSGALAVDVDATARGDAGAGASIAVVAGARPAGAGKVTAAAYATSSGYSSSGSVSTRIDVQASGAIDAIGAARSGDTYYDWRSGPPRSGDADSSVRGVTGGDHAVSLRASARAGDTVFGNFHVFGTSAGAAASTLGQSGRGAVDVLADARAGGGVRVFELDAYGHASASATAINLERGGRGIARAVIWGGSGEVLASASGIGRQGGTVRVTGAAATLPSESWVDDRARTVRGGAAATNYFDAAAFALPAYAGDTQIISNVGAAPDSAAELEGLALGPVVANGMASLTGVGMQALGTDSTRASWWNSAALTTASGRFEFDGMTGRHLLVGLVSSSFSGAFDSLELSITNHGVALFSRLFTDADEARLFFSDRLLDLGLFGAGMQDVLVSTLYTSYEPGTFAFNYVVGAGAGVTAVPEASTWLMLVLGLGGVTIVARRRRRV